MITVACILRSGSGGTYNQHHVWALRDAIKKYISVEHNFVCLTDMDVGDVHAIPFEMCLPGTWCQFELFRPGIYPENTTTVFYLDLDTLILGDITHIATCISKHTILRCPYQPKKFIGAGVMTFDPKHCEYLWESFKLDPANISKAKENNRLDTVWFFRNFWSKNLVGHEFLQDLFPDQIYSYKAHVIKAFKGHIPETAKIIYFHGKPRPWKTNLWTKYLEDIRKKS